MSFNPPPLPPFQPQWGQFQVWWQAVINGIVQALSGQQSQIDTINAMLDPDTLTPDKKPLWILFHAFLTGEQTALDTEATTYGITTEKTAYDSAISTLTAYLATLTTPVLWNDLTGNTAVTGATLHADFNDVLVKKQALLNKMHDAALMSAAAAKKTDKISASATDPSVVLSATDAGSNATITIAANVRRYGDGTTLSVAGGSLTGKAYSTKYAVYYDDSTMANTTPSYLATTTLKDAQPNAANGRHYVGQITTPAAAGGPASGDPYLPPGGGGPYP